MRRLLVSLVLPAVLLVAKTAHAETKFGYVDVQRAVSETDEGKQASARMQSEADDARKQLEIKKSGFQKMQADYEKQVSVLSEDAKQKKQDELRKAYAEIQQAASDLQASFDKKQQTLMAQISQRMVQVIAEVSDRDGLTYVVDKQALLFAPPAADVTNEVIRRYNEKFAAPGATEGKTTAKSGGKK